jgi:predicted nucleic acid-binding protein
MRYVVDTNIWGAFLGKNQKVRTHLREKLAQGHEICVISIVYFELIRWLELRNDLEKLHFIKQYWATLSWYDCTKQIWDEAVRLWVTSTRQNNKREDCRYPHCSLCRPASCNSSHDKCQAFPDFLISNRKLGC